MKRIDRKSLLLVATLLAAVVPAAFAGVARGARAECQDEVRREQALVADYARKLESAQWHQQVPSTTPVQPWRLLDSADVTGTLQVLQSLVDVSGVVLVTAKASPAGIAGRQLFLLTGNGSPEQICTLVAGIERCPRLVVIESGRITPNSETAVDFEFGLATYHAGGEQ